MCWHHINPLESLNDTIPIISSHLHFSGWSCRKPATLTHPITDHNSPGSFSILSQSRKVSPRATFLGLVFLLLFFWGWLLGFFCFFFGAQAVLSPCTNTNPKVNKNWRASSSPVSKRAETDPSISWCKNSWPGQKKINRKDMMWCRWKPDPVKISSQYFPKGQGFPPTCV